MPFPKAQTDYFEGQMVDNQDHGGWLGAEQVEIVGSSQSALTTQFVIGVASSFLAAWLFFECFNSKRG